MRTALWLLLAYLCAIPWALAQQAQVRVSNGPYYVDVPVDVEVTVEGFQRSPEPTVDVDGPAGAELKLVGVSPNFSSSIQIINGRMSRSERVRFVYRYRLLANRPGRLEVGPFQVTQGNASASAPAVGFDIAETPTTSEQRFRLMLPEGPLWVGQRLPVTVEWWLTESFAERLSGRRARVPLFDIVDRFKFEDADVPEARSTLVIDTATGTIELPVTVRRDQWQGKPYVVVTGRRTMIALKAGEVKVEPASILTEEAVRWSTDIFGNRTATSVRRLRIQDEPRTLVFKSPPTQGRPASFSGAIGKGLTVDVSADRSVVQTGDPIRLTIDVRGDAALGAISLPRLDASGLDPQDFKIPEGAAAGTVVGGAKRFDVVLRVNNDQVREIPSIALSWFNPELGQYETARSRPIAVSVRAATVVSAADVVRAPAHTGGDAGEAPGTEDSGEAEPPANLSARPAFTLSGAELSIETRADVLGKDPVPWFARPGALSAMYLGGLFSLGLAVVGHRRASVDPAVRARRQELAAQRRSVEQAPGVGDLARALRRMGAASTSLPRAEYDSLLLECDNHAYGPGAGDRATVDPQLRARAIALADAMVEGP